MVHRKEVLLGCYICRVQRPSVPVIKQHLNLHHRVADKSYYLKTHSYLISILYENMYLHPGS